MIRKVVITAAGLGTRLLPMTKELPKEMLPIYMSQKGLLVVKPLLQVLFEQLYDYGFRDFCFIVGRGKRSIEDHFTPDRPFLDHLDRKLEHSQISHLKTFYDRLQTASLVWVNQPSPTGFGDAVLRAEPHVGEEPFLVHAGDTLVISKHARHLKDLDRHFTKNVACVLVLKQIENPRGYGVAMMKRSIVKKVVEKPEMPDSDLAIMPLYVFDPKIFEALRGVKPGKDGEIQLTDGIQKLIDGGYKVRAVMLKKEDLRLDMGTPETYWEAQTLSYDYFQETKTRN